MSKLGLKTGIITAMALGMVGNEPRYGYARKPRPSTPTVTPSTERGLDHKVKTEQEKKVHKEHQKKIKSKRNAKKGIYAKKICYPRDRRAK